MLKNVSNPERTMQFCQVLGKIIAQGNQRNSSLRDLRSGFKKVDRPSGIFSEERRPSPKVAAAVFMAATLFFIHQIQANTHEQAQCTLEVVHYLLSFSFWIFLLHYDNCYNLLWPLEKKKPAECRAQF